MLSGSVAELPGGGTAGSTYSGLVVTNTAASTCILKGNPGVSYVGRGNGTQLGAPAGWDRSKKSADIALKSGASAQAILKQTNAGNYGARCRPVTADGLRVYPPSATDALFIKYTHPACANTNIVLMSVSAFERM